MEYPLVVSCVDQRYKGGPSEPSTKGTSDGPTQAYPIAHLEEALSVLFCLIDEAYTLLNPSALDARSP